MIRRAPTLLVVNFQMDLESPVLAWQHRVVQEMANHCRHLVVVTEKVGALALPANVSVWVVPHWCFRVPLRWLGAKWLITLLVYRLCKQYAFDACFIHMNMEQAYRLHWCLRRFNIPVLLWYAHRAVTWRLRLAHRCVDRVVTSTDWAFRISSSKVSVIGQGVDTRLFCVTPVTVRDDWIIAVGRVTPCKRIETMIRALAALVSLQPSRKTGLRIVGATLTARDRAYLVRLKSLASELGLGEKVVFDGHMPMEQLPSIYRRAHAMFNFCRTGALDKTVLEAMACGCPVFTSNASFAPLFRLHGLDRFLIEDQAPLTIAERVLAVGASARRRSMADQLRAAVLPHDLRRYVERVLNEVDSLRGSAFDREDFREPSLTNQRLSDAGP